LIDYRSTIYILLVCIFISSNAYADTKGMRPSMAQTKNGYIFCGGAIYGKPGTKKNSTYTDDCYFYTSQKGLILANFKYPVKAYNIQSQPINNDEILFFGGYDGSSYLANTYSFNIKKQKFSKMGNLPYGITAHSSVKLLNGTILSIGGATYEGSVKDIFSYKPEEKTWELFAQLPSIRHYSAAAPTSDGGFIVAGGAVKIPPEGHSKPHLSEILRYDTKNNNWKETTYLPTPQRGLELIPIGNDQFIIIGGQKNFDESCTPCYAKDIFLYFLKRQSFELLSNLKNHSGFTRSIYDMKKIKILFGVDKNGHNQIDSPIIIDTW